MERLKSPLRKKRDRIVRQIEDWIYFCAGAAVLALLDVLVHLLFNRLGV